MHPKILSPVVFLALACTCIAEIAVKPIAKGFERPVWAGAPKGVTDRLWVMEQAGSVWVVDLATGKWSDERFLDLRGEVSRKGNEEGLLGLAFAPDFAETGRYYVNYTDNDQHTCITRFVAKPGETNKVDAGEILLRYEQDFRNHNGGWIDFGPDGMLYIGNGDGGSGNDPKQRAQDFGSLLGKLLRIDVSVKEGYQVPADNPFVDKDGIKPEIYAVGLRNPWRCSFDRGTGDFWIGDVGQNHWEEIHHITAKELPGANFGWRLREGEVATPEKGVGGEKPENNIDPVYVYGHGGGDFEGLSVTGGYVHRGQIKPLEGRYIFADYQNPRIWSFVLENGKAKDIQDHTQSLQPSGGRINLISSFAELSDGSLFLVDHTGPIYQIVEK